MFELKVLFSSFFSSSFTCLNEKKLKKIFVNFEIKLLVNTKNCKPRIY